LVVVETVLTAPVLVVVEEPVVPFVVPFVVLLVVLFVVPLVVPAVVLKPSPVVCPRLRVQDC